MVFCVWSELFIYNEEFEEKEDCGWLTGVKLRRCRRMLSVTSGY